MHILVVDDDPVSLETISKSITKLGLLVETAKTGFEAISKVKNNPNIKTVILDRLMPGLNGEDTARLIRRTRLESQPYIIMVTASDIEENLNQIVKCGANICMSKPVHPEVLALNLDIADKTRDLIEYRLEN